VGKIESDSSVGFIFPFLKFHLKREHARVPSHERGPSPSIPNLIFLQFVYFDW
jgi:hypothetical protein